MEDANACVCLIYLPRTCRASRPTPMPPPINIEEYLDRSMMGWRPLGTRTSIVDGHKSSQVSETAVSLLCGPRAVGIGVGRLRRTTSGSGRQKVASDSPVGLVGHALAPCPRHSALVGLGQA